MLGGIWNTRGTAANIIPPANPRATRIQIRNLPFSRLAAERSTVRRLLKTAAAQRQTVMRTIVIKYVVVAVAVVLVFGGCVELQRSDTIWESPGPIKVRIGLKYSWGNDYYFFDAFDSTTGRWKRVMSVWRDATGLMPVENVRSVDSRIGFLFLADQVAVTSDGGSNWTVFNASKYFDCGWDGCAPIKDVSFSTAGVGIVTGLKRVGTDWTEFKITTKDFGGSWRTNNGA